MSDEDDGDDRFSQPVVVNSVEHTTVFKESTVKLRTALFVGGFAASIALFLAVFVYYVDTTRTTESDRALRTAQSSLSNCEQIEAVKGQIRIVLRDSRDALPKRAEYKNNPERLGEAYESLTKSIGRFSPIDCYQLPTVKAAGLKPEKEG